MTRRKDASVGSLVRQLREAAGLSKAALARRSGVDVANVHRLETGEATQPKPDTLSRLAEALGADAGDLLTAAGYTAGRADALPSLPMYMRTKYGYLPPAAVRELTEYAQRIEAEYRRSRGTAKPAPGGRTPTKQ